MQPQTPRRQSTISTMLGWRSSSRDMSRLLSDGWVPRQTPSACNRQKRGTIGPALLGLQRTSPRDAYLLANGADKTFGFSPFRIKQLNLTGEVLTPRRSLLTEQPEGVQENEAVIVSKMCYIRLYVFSNVTSQQQEGANLSYGLHLNSKHRLVLIPRHPYCLRSVALTVTAPSFT